MNQKLLNLLAAETARWELDAFFMAPSAELTALIGFSPFYCFRIQGLFILADGRCAYLCNRLSSDELSNALPGVPVYAWHDNDGYLETFHQLFEDFGLLGKRIGVNKTVRAFDVLSIMAHFPVQFVDASELFPEVSIHKTDVQIGYMRRAAAIAGEALQKTLPLIHSGMTEQDLRHTLVENMRQLGGEEPEAMIASGPNSGYPHYFEETRTLQPGDAIIIDFGCAYCNYRTDITRMVYLGEMSELQRRLYGLVLQASQVAISCLHAGERWIPAIDASARNLIDTGGYRNAFTTRLGHGIGVMGHEAPEIKACNPRFLEGGMCFSIEPGIYLGKEGGVRIEDCACILPDGTPEVLTDCIPKEPIILHCEPPQLL